MSWLNRLPRSPSGLARAAAGLAPVLIGAALLGGSAPARAHHAFAAEYDAEQPFDLSGVVIKARWVNPHSWLYVAVPATDGTVTQWGFEFGAPNVLARKGLTKADLQPGTRVHVRGYRSKNGGHWGYSVTLTLGDGRTFQTGGAQDSPPPPKAGSGAAAGTSGAAQG